MDYSELDKCFIKRLSQLRGLKKVSAREMSLSIGQSEAYINSIENGNSLPSMTVFFYICEYLGVTPSEFFDFDNRNPQETGELIAGFRRLNLKQQGLVLALIKEITPR
ncbi:MAG: helix-turn-helix domain-containing protein [Oscillospiraceae bacterium]